MFSIVIPTWNNVEYLANCIASLRRNSSLDNEILVHVNEGRDGTAQWCRDNGIAFAHTAANIGICLALNGLASRATRPWLAYVNDDMVACPGWDTAFAREIAARKSVSCLLSGRLIEPVPTRNSRVLFEDYGRDLASFRADELFARCRSTRLGSSAGASQPTVVHRALWTAVGGYSVEFSPGMSSDDDFVMKLWLVGCRDFMIVDEARFYHFGQVSTGRIRKNRGSKAFLQKWGVSHKTMYRGIESGSSAELESLLDPPWSIRIKRMVQGLLHGAPRADLNRFRGTIGADWIDDPALARKDPSA